MRSDSPFLSERMKIKKCNKLVCKTSDKENYVLHIKSLKQALNHGLVQNVQTSIFSLVNTRN